MSDIPRLEMAGDPATRLVVAGFCLMPAVLFGAWTIAPTGMMVSLAAFVTGLALAVRAMARSYSHSRLGGANLVTTFRLALCATVASAVMVSGTQVGWTAWAPAILATVALCLDGIDGLLARRQSLTAAFGARYDMEVDSGLAAVLAAVLLVRGTAGAELLVLGGARYLFVGAIRLWPWLDGPLPDSLRRKTVCVIQTGTLIALTVPVFPDILTRPAAFGAAALVVWSFAVDIRWLSRRA